MTIYTFNLPTSEGRAIMHRSQLSGVAYVLEWQYVTRDDSWYLNLYTAGGDPIALGIKAVVEYPLLSRVTDPRKPAGRLALIDTSGRGLDPGADDLFGRVKLIYDDRI